MNPRTVLTLGEGLGVFRASVPDALLHDDTVGFGVGGAELNVAIGLARLGVPAMFVGVVGDDGVGRRIARELRAEGVDVRLRVEPAAATGVLVKEAGRHGTTSVQHYRAAAAGRLLCPAELDLVDWDDVALVHVTGIPLALSDSAGEAVRVAVAAARLRSIPVSFDVNHRPRLWGERDAPAAYRSLASQADVLFAGLDEAALLAGEPASDPESVARRLASSGYPEVVVKDGAAGAGALLEGRWLWADAVRTVVVDTVGAGDAFVAGYLSERIRGSDPARRLEVGVLAGAAACEHAGDWEGALRRSDLLPREGRDPVQR